jgi:hypothetical protein
MWMKNGERPVILRLRVDKDEGTQSFKTIS